LHGVVCGQSVGVGVRTCGARPNQQRRTTRHRQRARKKGGRTHRHQQQPVLDERAVVDGEGEAGQRDACAGAVHAERPGFQLVPKVHRGGGGGGGG